jgi:hypothetical protein
MVVKRAIDDITNPIIGFKDYIQKSLIKLLDWIKQRPMRIKLN